MTDLFGLPTDLPCLSLWEPWASLIVAGVKRNETRHWSTRVRGPIAIHAAKKVDLENAPTELCDQALGQGWETARPRGHVVAVALLTVCRPTHHVGHVAGDCDELAGNFAPDRFAFMLENVRPLREPLPLVGRRGFFRWTPPEDLAGRLLPAVDQGLALARWLTRP